MRGCLAVLAMGLVVLAVLIVVGAPIATSALVRQGIMAAGLDAADLAVDVSAGPTDLLALRAARIHITATDATWEGSQVGRLDLVLEDVDLATRRAGTIRGTLSDVRAVAGGGSELRLPVDRVELAGPSGAVDARVSIADPAAEALIAGRIRESTALAPTSVRLAAPDRLVLGAGGLEFEGRLVVDVDGALRLESTVPALPSVVLVEADALPIRLTGVAVRDGSLALTGVLERSLTP